MSKTVLCGICAAQRERPESTGPRPVLAAALHDQNLYKVTMTGQLAPHCKLAQQRVSSVVIVPARCARIGFYRSIEVSNRECRRFGATDGGGST
jgi:hypothetical protein